MKFFVIDDRYRDALNACADELYAKSNVGQILRTDKTRKAGRDFIIQLILNVLILAETGADAIVCPRDKTYWVKNYPHNPRKYTQ